MADGEKTLVQIATFNLFAINDERQLFRQFFRQGNLRCRPPSNE